MFAIGVRFSRHIYDCGDAEARHIIVMHAYRRRDVRGGPAHACQQGDDDGKPECLTRHLCLKPRDKKQFAQQEQNYQAVFLEGSFCIDNNMVELRPIIDFLIVVVSAFSAVILRRGIIFLFHP